MSLPRKLHNTWASCTHWYLLSSISHCLLCPAKKNRITCNAANFELWIHVFSGSTSVWLGGRRSWTDVCTGTYLMHANLLCGESAPACFHCGALPTISHILINCHFYLKCCRFHIQDMMHSFVCNDHWIVCNILAFIASIGLAQSVILCCCILY